MKYYLRGVHANNCYCFDNDMTFNGDFYSLLLLIPQFM